MSNVFESLFYSPGLHLFNLKYSINSNIVKYYYKIIPWFFYEL